MIVITAQNNTKILKLVLNSINKIIDFSEKVLIVCTDPEQKTMIYFVNILSKKNNFKFNFLIDKVKTLLMILLLTFMLIRITFENIISFT